MEVFPEPGIIVTHRNPFTMIVPEIRAFELVTVSLCIMFIRSNLNEPCGVGPSMYPAIYTGDGWGATAITNVIPSELPGMLTTAGVVLSVALSYFILFCAGVFDVHT
jgi:hypothetical protein